MAEKQIGEVIHWYGKASVVAFEMSAGELAVGDTIHVLGATSDFTHAIESMQIEHEEVESAKKGDQVGVQVTERARVGDKIFLVAPD